MGRKAQVYTIPVVLAPDPQPGFLLHLAAGKEVAFPILSELPCGQALGRGQLSRGTPVSLLQEALQKQIPFPYSSWCGAETPIHAYHIPGRTLLSRSGYFEAKSSPF